MIRVASRGLLKSETTPVAEGFSEGKGVHLSGKRRIMRAFACDDPLGSCRGQAVSAGHSGLAGGLAT